MDWESSRYSLDDDAVQAPWTALWKASPQRSPFSSIAYARAVVDAFGLRGDVYLVSSQKHVEAGAVVYWRRRGPYRQVVIPPFTQYSPFLLHDLPRETDVHHRRSALDALLAALDERFHLIRCFCPGLPDVRAALWRDWEATPFYTYQVRLQETTDLTAQWSGSTRRSFEKHREDYHLDEDTFPVDATVSLYEAGYRRHGRPLPAERERLLKLVRTLHDRGHVRHFTATPPGGDEPHAGVVVIHDGHTADYWLAGSRPGPAMTVLLGHLMPLLREDGIEVLDFVGANTPSIAEFKRHFGGTLVPYSLLEYVARPELRLWKALRR